MTALFAAIVGYLIGSVPTANSLARLVSVDLRNSGSGNPGANNALRMVGWRLAATVLLVEAAKGAAAVGIGGVMAGQAGMVTAGVGAAAGNVFNPWYRFQGGKGLGITLGVLAAAWPSVALPALAAIGLLALATRSSGHAALITALALFVVSFVPIPWGGPWGLTDTGLAPWLAGGLGLVLTPRHLRDARNRL